jgi:hypothetical protein
MAEPPADDKTGLVPPAALKMGMQPPDLTGVHDFTGASTQNHVLGTHEIP